MMFPQAQLGAYVDVVGGFAFKSETFAEEGVPIIRISDIQDGAVSLEKAARIPVSNIGKGARFTVEPGDILIAMSGATTGKIGLAPQNLAGCVLQNQRVGNFKIRHPDEMLKGYLKHFVCSATYQNQVNILMAGAAQPNISSSQLESISLPVPPLPEQHRIAAILDQADALRAKRREALAQLDSLTQSIFIEMFGDPVANSMKWPDAKLGDLTLSASDGPHVSPTYAESGIPFLSTRHVRPGEVTWDDMKFISPSDAAIQWKKCKPQLGDILYTKGGTTGFAAIVDTAIEFAVWVHVALLKPNLLKVHSKWLECMLNSAYCYRQSQDFTHGIANRDLGLKRMVNIRMYQPPLSLQNEFASRMLVHSALVKSNREALAELDRLFTSLQHRAFSGEL